MGVSNFEFLFTSGTLWEVTKNTILYNIAFILVSLVMEVLDVYKRQEWRNAASFCGNSVSHVFFLFRQLNLTCLFRRRVSDTLLG